ncbi:hypothetical protein MWN33_15600 [Starkeya koreensis]|uniref:Uncharacterized protein n=1 Tax=Ancylobacter koreensis TaxID=266121 RepID=A0ABT0DQ93_9HYPH|nr:hypothetical protein [Ancylobacter koreensis]MCK0209458.1 hypothetical protein [Ancylobacter koreensis]
MSPVTVSVPMELPGATVELYPTITVPTVPEPPSEALGSSSMVPPSASFTDSRPCVTVVVPVKPEPSPV